MTRPGYFLNIADLNEYEEVAKKVGIYNDESAPKVVGKATQLAAEFIPERQEDKGIQH